MENDDLLIADQDFLRIRELEQGDELAAELERATIVPLAQMPDDVVRMHSRVRYSIGGNQASQEVELVFPEEADAAAGKVSVLAPVGAALLGLREGQCIAWSAFPDGKPRQLAVIRSIAPVND